MASAKEASRVVELEVKAANPKRPRIDSPENAALTAAPETEISRGAEGLVTRLIYLGRRAVRKERFPKPYRHPELDAKLTSRRLAQEARVLLRLRKSGIRVPAVFSVDFTKNSLILEDLGGVTLKEFLHQGVQEGGLGEQVMRKAGREVAQMHKSGVVHGDLTTGNIIVLTDAKGVTVDEGEAAVCLIDFGLSGGGGTEEEMAVDLYVFERAVISAHSEAAEPLNEAFLEAYREALERPAVLTRLAEVRSRGRKRDMIG